MTFGKRQKRGKPDPSIPGLEWFNHGLVSLRWQRGLPRLVVHEKYERRVRWTLRALTLIGIALSVVNIPLWYASLGVTVASVLVEQFLERIIFQYTAIVITPVPTFSFSMDEITGMGFALRLDNDPNHPDMAGFAFEREDLAEKFFELLREWNYGEQEDRDNNIRMTVVWPQRGDGYYVCMFPSMDRKGVKDRFEKMREASALKKYGKEQHELVMIWTMRKTFVGGGRALRQFLARQRPDRPFRLQAFLSKDGKQNEILFDIKPILKWHLRVVREDELKRPDVEWWLVCNPGDLYRREVVGEEK